MTDTRYACCVSLVLVLLGCDNAQAERERAELEAVRQELAKLRAELDDTAKRIDEKLERQAQAQAQHNLEIPGLERSPVVPTVKVVLNEDGDIELDGHAVEFETLKQQLCAHAKDTETPALSIQSAQTTRPQQHVELMDVAKECGITHISLSTG